MQILPLQELFRRKGPGIVIALKAVRTELPENIPHACGKLGIMGRAAVDEISL